MGCGGAIRIAIVYIPCKVFSYNGSAESLGQEKERAVRELMIKRNKSCSTAENGQKFVSLIQLGICVWCFRDLR